MKYQGYWFWDLRNDKIIQAKDLSEEYVLLNCPQECEGPFKNEIIANEYKKRNPNLSKDYLEFVRELYEF
jgi:hypothetical protein